MRLRTTLISAFAGVATIASALACASARADETPLAFQGNLFDQLPEPFFPTMFRTRDLDGDGFPDLVIAGRDPDDRLITQRGLGNGRFVTLQTLAAPGFVDWVELADIDGDGREDIVGAWRGDVPRLVCYRGLAGGLFEEALVLADVELGGVGRDPQSVALGDFDGDGDVDVAVCNYIGQSIDVFSSRVANGGGLAFERTARVRLGQFLGGIAYPRLVHAGDMDGDGDLDLVVNQIGASRIAVIRNEAGRFVAAKEYRVPILGAERPGIAGMDLADIDGDGDLDVVCPALLLDSAQRVLAFVNDGTGALTQTLDGDGAPTGYSFSLLLADFDGDGDLDAVSGAALPGTIAIGRRTGAGAFTFEIDQSFQFGSLIRHLAAIDVDGDCDLDLVGIDAPSRTVFTRRNVTPQQGSGCGGFAEAQQEQPKSLPRKSTGKQAIAARPTPARESVPMADRDHNGVVDAADVAIWIAELSQAVAPQPVKAGAK